MQWEGCEGSDLSRARYSPDPYWYAWRPVLAKAGWGKERWVWLEYVKWKREFRTWNGPYGVGRGLVYTYETVSPEVNEQLKVRKL
jgi:hypothetical protein